MSSPGGEQTVGIRPDQVDAGVRSWEAAYEALDNAWQGARGGILALSTPATWGGDAAGQAFAAYYLASGGPAEVLFGVTGGGGVIANLGQGGPAVTAAVGSELAQDQANAAALPSPGA